MTGCDRLRDNVAWKVTECPQVIMTRMQLTQML
jgi:hypothetical protein